MSLTDLAGAILIELTAVDEGRNCRRAYRIDRTEDLFGHQLIELSWGRIGKRPVETVVGNGQFRDAGGGTGMTDCGWFCDCQLVPSERASALLSPRIAVS